jgi:hypothetical protein
MGSDSSIGRICIQQFSEQEHKKIPFEIVYGIQPRGITELRNLNQDEFRSAGAEDFAKKM